jgi:hypothetical protein
MGNAEDLPNLTLSTKVLSSTVVDEFCILVAKFTVEIKLYVIINEFVYSAVFIDVVCNYAIRD